MLKGVRSNNKGIFNTFIIIAIVCVSICTIMNINYKDTNIDKIVGVVSTSNCTVKAEIYDDNICSGTGIALTSSGVSISGWDYDKSKFLKVTASVDADEGKEHIVEVTLPKEFYVVTDNIYEIPTGYASVEFVKNGNISVNGGTEVFYSDDNSGKLTYVMDKDISSVTMVLELRYDEALWDKQEGSAITENGVVPIKVAMKHKNESSYLNEIKVSKVTAGKATERFLWQLVETGDYHYATTKTKTLYVEIIKEGAFYEELYYKELMITIKHPYWTESNGKKYYLECIKDEVRVYVEEHPNIKYSIEVGESETKIIIDNYYMWTCSDDLVIPFKLPSTLPSLSDKYLEFNNGKIIVTGTSNNGTKDVEVISSNIQNMYYQIDATEDVYVFTNGNREVHNDKKRDAVLYMGGFYIENTGCVDSTKKTITFTFPNELLITTVNLFSDKISDYIDVEYSLKDDNGNQIYFDSSGNIVSAGTSGARTTWTYRKENDYDSEYDRDDIQLTFSRQEIPTAHRQYFFKEVKYSIQKIEENVKLFQESGMYSPDGGGNFFGYLRNDAKLLTPYTSSIKVESPTSSGIATISSSMDTILTDKKITSTQMRVKVKNAPAEGYKAGDIIKITGDADGHRYPYGTTNKVNDINIGILLPEGIIIDENSIKLSTSMRDVEVEKVYIKGNKDGFNCWIIEVQSDVYVGYFDENLSKMQEGSGIDFEMDLVTDVTLPSTNLYTNEMFFFAGEGYENWSYAPEECVDDVWDINNDGDYESGFAIIPENSAERIFISNNSLMINVVDSVMVDGAGSVTDKTATLKDKNDIVTYAVNVESLEIGTLKQYNHYITIPKKNSPRDNMMIQTTDKDGFDFELVEAVSFSGNDIFEALYTVEQDTSFSTLKNYGSDKWMTLDTLKSKYTLADVTAVKIVLKSGTAVSSDFDSHIYVKMLSTNKDAKQGAKNSWKSRAYYSFDHSSGNVSGYQGTKGCMAIMDYDPNGGLRDTENVYTSDGVDFRKTASWCEYKGKKTDENGNPYVKIEFMFNPTEYCDMNGYPLYPQVQQDTVVKDRQEGKLNIQLAVPRIYIMDYIPGEFTLIEDSIEYNDESFVPTLGTYSTYASLQIELHKSFERKEYLVSFVTVLDISKLSDEYISGEKKINTNGQTIDSSVDSMGSSYLYYDFGSVELESPSLNYKALKTDEDVTDTAKVKEDDIEKEDLYEYDETPATNDMFDFKRWIWIMMIVSMGIVILNKNYKYFIK